MKGDSRGFKLFVEDKTHSIHKPKPKANKENLIDGMARELGIDPNTLGDIDSGPIELDGIFYNQAVWQIVKPVDANDNFVKVKFIKSKSPDLNQRAFIKQQNGTMQPYVGDISSSEHLITMDKLGEMLGRPWQSVVAQAAQGGMPTG